MTISKHELKEGLTVKTTWKNKIYEGEIIGDPKKEAKKSARLTSGRFISIPIITKWGRIIQMPYTSRTNYEIID